MDILGLLEALPPGTLGKALRVIADVSDHDPNLLQELHDKNYGPIILGIEKDAPELVAEIVASAVPK